MISVCYKWTKIIMKGNNHILRQEKTYFPRQLFDWTCISFVSTYLHTLIWIWFWCMHTIVYYCMYGLGILLTTYVCCISQCNTYMFLRFTCLATFEVCKIMFIGFLICKTFLIVKTQFLSSYERLIIESFSYNFHLYLILMQLILLHLGKDTASESRTFYDEATTKINLSFAVKLTRTIISTTLNANKRKMSYKGSLDV